MPPREEFAAIMLDCDNRKRGLLNALTMECYAFLRKLDSSIEKGNKHKRFALIGLPTCQWAVVRNTEFQFQITNFILKPDDIDFPSEESLKKEGSLESSTDKCIWVAKLTVDWMSNIYKYCLDSAFLYVEERKLLDDALIDCKKIPDIVKGFHATGVLPYSLHVCVKCGRITSPCGVNQKWVFCFSCLKYSHHACAINVWHHKSGFKCCGSDKTMVGVHGNVLAPRKLPQYWGHPAGLTKDQIVLMAAIKRCKPMQSKPRRGVHKP